MAKHIKNTSGSDSTYQGQLISNGAYYQLQAHEEKAWASDDTLLTDIGNGDALVAKTDDGLNDLGISEGIDYLKDVIDPVISIKEESQKTETDKYKARCYAVDIPQNTDWNILKDIVLPFPVNIFNALFNDKANREGDCVRVEVGPETNVGGQVDVATAVGDTVIEVNAAVTTYMKKSYHAIFDAGGANHEEIEVHDVDPVAGTITLASGVQFVHAVGTSVKLSYRMIDDLEFDGVDVPINIGLGLIGGSLLAKNNKLRIKYKSSDGAAGKRFRWQMEVKN